MAKSKPPIKEAQAEINRVRRSIDRTRKSASKSIDKQLKQTLKTIAGMGIYDPKSDILTPYRRKRIRSIQREYKEFLAPGAFFFLPAPKDKKKTILERAQNLGMVTTRKGLIIPADKHKRAVLKENPKGEFYVERSGKTKQGPNKGRRYRTISPLASLDEMEKQKDRLRKQAASLGKIKEGEYLNFIIKEGGLEGAGKRFFKNIEDLFAYLDTYVNPTKNPKTNQIIKQGKTKSALIHFYRHVHIVKSTPTEFNKRFPPKGMRQRVTKGYRIRGR